MSDSDADAGTEDRTPAEYSDGWLTNDEVQSILTEALDETDYQIYRVLNENGRISDTELGERVGLSRTAVRRRREKLQSEGVLDILAVLILQEADLAYADVRIKLSPNPTIEEVEAFINDLLYEEIIYEIDEYIGDYDLLIRCWHSSLRDLKRYIAGKFQNHDVVESYRTDPIIKTMKAWHKVLDDGTDRGPTR